MYNIANVAWQLVHYTVYGTQKSDNGLGDYRFSSSRKLYSGRATIQYLYSTRENTLTHANTHFFKNIKK